MGKKGGQDGENMDQNGANTIDDSILHSRSEFMKCKYQFNAQNQIGARMWTKK